MWSLPLRSPVKMSVNHPLHSLPTLALSQPPPFTHSVLFPHPHAHSPFHSFSPEMCMAFLMGVLLCPVPAKQTHPTVLSFLRTHGQCHWTMTSDLQRGVGFQQSTGLQNTEALVFLTSLHFHLGGFYNVYNLQINQLEAHAQKLIASGMKRKNSEDYWSRSTALLFICTF